MAKIERDEELGKRPKVREHIIKVATDVEKAFVDQHERSDAIMDQWDVYNCKLTGRQFYDGNTRIFVPIIRDAVRARRTRFLNQIFPMSGRYVEVTTSDIDLPEAQMSLAEHYIRASKLRTEVMPALLTSGDVEGQYSIYVTWEEIEKRVAKRVDKAFEADGLQFEEIGVSEDMEEETIIDAGPKVEVISDNDIIILPVTADSIPEAIAVGGSVTIARRWTKAQIKKMKADGDILPDVADDMVKAMNAKRDTPNNDTPKKMADAAGIKTGGGDKFVLVYEIWTHVKVGGETYLCRAYYGGDSNVLGVKRNPYWCDEVPLISCPVEKIAGVFKGQAPVTSCMDMQILANDAVNEGADAAHFSAMPIIMTDPEKNPKVGTMVLGLASIWETSPKDTQFAQFPELWNAAVTRVQACKEQIFQSLGVNPAMIPQNTGVKNKRNQAEIAMEQQVDLLTTADAVTTLEEGILTPLIQRFMAYDHQFRDRALTVKHYGEMGIKANMEEIPPVQMNHRYEYRWFGVEAARNAQQIQQQIAMANVIKGIPPQMLPGYRLNMVPLVNRLADNSFGHRLAPLIFEKVQGVTVPADVENQLMTQGFETPVHPDDNDMEHLQAHMQAIQLGDFHGHMRTHIMLHQQQMQAKAQAAQAQMQPKGLPGGPGGAGPGVAGSPRPGAQPAMPRQMKQPEGAIPPDSMGKAGVIAMPRRM